MVWDKEAQKTMRTHKDIYLYCRKKGQDHIKKKEREEKNRRQKKWITGDEKGGKNGFCLKSDTYLWLSSSFFFLKYIFLLFSFGFLSLRIFAYVKQ